MVNLFVLIKVSCVPEVQVLLVCRKLPCCLWNLFFDRAYSSSSRVSFPITFAIAVLFVSSTVPTSTIAFTVCVSPRRESCRMSLPCPDVDHLFDVLLGILFKQMTQPLRVWQKFQVLFLGALHVHDVYRVVARLLSGLLSMELSSFVSFEAAWHQPSSFEGCLVLRKPGIVDVFCRM